MGVRRYIISILRGQTAILPGSYIKVNLNNAHIYIGDINGGWTDPPNGIPETDYALLAAIRTYVRSNGFADISIVEYLLNLDIINADQITHEAV